ncbi:hypothetical protein VTO73DRAFT_4777 [Trametes versicolor]
MSTTPPRLTSDSPAAQVKFCASEALPAGAFLRKRAGIIARSSGKARMGAVLVLLATFIYLRFTGFFGTTPYRYGHTLVQRPVTPGLSPPELDEYASSVCPQAKPLSPTRHRALDDELSRLFAEDTYKLDAYKAFGGAIQIPTESYDDMRPVGEDSRWDIFGELYRYLDETFPRV